MDKYDHDLLKRIEYIRDQLNQHKGKYRSADQVSKQTHDYLREKLTVDAGQSQKTVSSPPGFGGQEVPSVVLSSPNRSRQQVLRTGPESASENHRDQNQD